MVLSFHWNRSYKAMAKMLCGEETWNSVRGIWVLNLTTKTILFWWIPDFSVWQNEKLNKKCFRSCVQTLRTLPCVPLPQATFASAFVTMTMGINQNPWRSEYPFITSETRSLSPSSWICPRTTTYPRHNYGSTSVYSPTIGRLAD